MRTEDIIESLQLRCADGGFNDYLLVNALSRLRTLQSVSGQRDQLLEALEFALETVYNWGEYADYYFKEKHGFDADVKRIKDAIAKAKAKGEK